MQWKGALASEDRVSNRRPPNLDATVRDLVAIAQTIIGQIVTNRLRTETRRPETKADHAEHVDRPIPRESLLPLPEVCRLAGGLSPAMVYELVAAGEFPNSVQLTKQRVAWRAGDVFDWCASRPPSPPKRAASKRGRMP